MHNEIISLINSKVSNANATLINPPEDGAGDSSILINPESVFETMKCLLNSKFNALQVISGVDYTEYLEVCYMLANFDPKDHREAIIKTRLTDRDNPTLDSICSLSLAANWQERECYDMIGVKFNNHPDHRRILCPDDWEGFPLRKDYKVQEVYRGMEVNPEAKMNRDDQLFENQKQTGNEEELLRKALERGL